MRIQGRHHPPVNTFKEGTQRLHAETYQAYELDVRSNR